MGLSNHENISLVLASSNNPTETPSTLAIR